MPFWILQHKKSGGLRPDQYITVFCGRGPSLELQAPRKVFSRRDIVKTKYTTHIVSYSGRYCRYCPTKSQSTKSEYALINCCVTGPGSCPFPTTLPLKERTAQMHRLVDV